MTFTWEGTLWHGHWKLVADPKIEEAEADLLHSTQELYDEEAAYRTDQVGVVVSDLLIKPPDKADFI